ncbi:tRNA pseudouridine(38-40) synthase TruA [Butyrivibrio sp. VCB2006]|uniref:tRNA pseudouridine(38-40) synthase TruA n=1 Tax=Butyrivibrio sp. VCB2006 TaxID=1280679 RepID=UPI0004166B98|nr:tRNA pseudouridine(38-40) synthase TruA [Butyrivibrio sp. VCB2006]
MKQNYKLVISYDGTRYHGWEKKSGVDTIQGKLESVLNRMVNAEGNEEVNLIGAGRTDAGVHARAMTASVVLDTQLSEAQIQSYLNSYLPEDISVGEVKACSERFHARYNAIGKTYRYTCWYGSSKPVFDRKYVTVLDKEPDVAKMRRAAQYLVGEHDFKSFCGNNKMKKSTVRCVDTINIEESGNYIRFYFHGNGFLQNMVRILTGTLLEVGYGNITPEGVKDILEACDRSKAGPTARPEGLCMMKVDY